MRRQLLSVMAAAFADWLRPQLDPAGKAALHTFAARASVVIDALPDGADGGDEAPPLAGLDPASVEAGLGWLLTALRAAYPEEGWPLACESLRLLLRRNAAAVVSLCVPPEGPAP